MGPKLPQNGPLLESFWGPFGIHSGSILGSILGPAMKRRIEEGTERGTSPAGSAAGELGEGAMSTRIVNAAKKANGELTAGELGPARKEEPTFHCTECRGFANTQFYVQWA